MDGGIARRHLCSRRSPDRLQHQYAHEPHTYLCGAVPAVLVRMAMHPLVLGLAEPESALSSREGLKWDDAAGEAIARRVDPEAAYLSDRYEPALARYYIG